MQPTDSTPAARTLVWDWPTRLFHWTLVLSIAGAFVSQWFYERIPFAVHEVFGSAALVLVTFRLLWGFVGPLHARFADFLVGPVSVFAYLRQVRQRNVPVHAGHTPAGGWMIIVLLVLVAVQAATGLFANDESDAAGYLYGYVSHADSNRLTGIHHLVANLLQIAVVVHVLAVLAYRHLLGIDLVRPMLHGRREGVPSTLAIEGHRGWLAAILLAACAGALLWLIRSAPDIPDMLM